MIIPADSCHSSMSSEDWISYLGLQPLDREGGWFRETWRSSESIHQIMGISNRSAATAIYYLLNRGQHSRLHYLPGPEIYCHHAGAPMSLLLLGEPDYPEGREVLLGRNIDNGEIPQLVVQGGVIQAGSPVGAPDWCLVSTFMSPGFEFEDYKEPDIESLLSKYPHLRLRILRHS